MIGTEILLVQRVAPGSAIKYRTVAGLLLTAVLCLSMASAGAAPAAPVPGETAAAAPIADEEAARLAQALPQELPGVLIDKPESAQAWIDPPRRL